MRNWVVGTGFAVALCVFGHTARAAPEAYDFEGYIVRSTVVDPAVPLPDFLVPVDRTELIGTPIFIGSVVVDPALPPNQRLLDFRVFAFTGERLQALAGHPDNGVISQTSLDVSSGATLPPWEIVIASARTAPLPAQAGRSIGMSLQWNGEPGAQRQYPAGAQKVDLAALTPVSNWRINFTLSDASGVYAVSSGNVVIMHRRGTGGPDYQERFNDGLAQGWTPRQGTWSAATQDLRNNANTLFTSMVSNVVLPSRFEVLSDVYLSWGNTGNTAGVLFNYHGPGDFRELRLNALGTATLSEVQGGVRRILDARTYPNAGVRRWSNVHVKRHGFADVALQIEINGQQVFDLEFDPSEPDQLAGGMAGVFASWNLARFDNFRIGAPIRSFFWNFDRFPVGGVSNVVPQSGRWTMANGYLRSSANLAASIALYGVPREGSRAEVYGISARIELEWSGAGNAGGFVYDYIDARNYREVRLSRSVPGRVGEVILAEIVNGVRREVFRAPRYRGLTNTREVVVTLRREHDRTTVSDLNAFINIQVRQAPPTVPTVVGLFAAWNMVRFDDVVVYSVPDQ